MLTSDNTAIKRNHLSSIYLDYIKMIQAKEEASKDAPTEEVKNNVNKIYNEVNSGGAFSLTGCIPTGAEYFRADTSGLGNSADSLQLWQLSSSDCHISPKTRLSVSVYLLWAKILNYSRCECSH